MKRKSGSTQRVSRRNVLKSCGGRGRQRRCSRLPGISSRRSRGQRRCAGRAPGRSKDIFHEFAPRLRQEGQRHDRAATCKIDVLARRRGRCRRFRLLDAVSRGHPRRRPRRAAPTGTASSKRLRAVGSSPAYGMDANTLPRLAQYGGGRRAAQASSHNPLERQRGLASRTARCRRSRSAGTRSR